MTNTWVEQSDRGARMKITNAYIKRRARDVVVEENVVVEDNAGAQSDESTWVAYREHQRRQRRRERAAGQGTFTSSWSHIFLDLSHLQIEIFQ